MGLILNTAQALLPQQGALHDKPWSLERENQRANVLASGIHAAFGAGLLTTGNLVVATGHAVKLAAGEILFVGGVAWLLDADLVCNDTAVNATNQVWATLIATRANQVNRADLDTYAPTLNSTTTGLPPASPPAGAGPYFLVGTVTIDAGGAITSITPAAGRYLAASPAFVGQMDYVPLGAAYTIPQGRQEQVFRRLTVRGRLVIRGRLRVRT